MITSIAFSYRVGNTTAGNIIKETTSAIWDVLYPKVFPKYSKEMWQDVEEMFYNTTNFPNCIGALDGKHIVIQVLF